MIAPLRDRRTLQLVREQGQRGRSGSVTVRFAPSARDPRLFVAFAIGRRTGTAVVRNRVRRRLRAALVELARTRSLPSGAAVISAGPSLATVPFPRLRHDLDQALARAARSAP